MATRQVNVARVTVRSSKGFHDVVAAFEAAIGRPDMESFGRQMASAKTFAEVERIILGVVGPSDLMQFLQLDLGAYLRVKNGTAKPNSIRFIVGNPLIMCRMLQHLPDVGSYAPVTILIDERPEGVHLSYDRMASFLAPYGSSEALKVAQELDEKVERLLAAAAE